MTQTYIVGYNVPLLGLRIFLRLAAFSVGVYFVANGGYLILPPVLFVLAYSFTYSAIEIDFDRAVYHEYTALLGLRWGDRGNLSDLHTILLKDTLFTARNSLGQITNSDDCYEVSLLGDDRKKLILLYTYDKEDAVQRALELQEKLGYPIHDISHEQLTRDYF